MAFIRLKNMCIIMSFICFAVAAGRRLWMKPHDAPLCSALDTDLQQSWQISLKHKGDSRDFYTHQSPSEDYGPNSREMSRAWFYLKPLLKYNVKRGQSKREVTCDKVRGRGSRHVTSSFSKFISNCNCAVAFSPGSLRSCSHILQKHLEPRPTLLHFL